MKTLRSLEGELIIDHRYSPGVPQEILKSNGRPPEAGRGLYESATYTCNHCQAIVVMNPNRTRERHYCGGCSHIICDGCAAEKARTLQCVTFQQKVDRLLSGK
jgi:hypothetical protein